MSNGDSARTPSDLVASWLLLDPDAPACHDALDVIDSIGQDTQRESARVATALHVPLGDSSAHTSDTSEIASTLADLRRELDALDPAELNERPGLFGRVLARIPGVGTASSRYAQRVASSRPRIDEVVSALASGRGVLSRDNITLRADQERLHELSDSLTDDLGIAQAFEDALVFTIDVELPFGDSRRPFFEDDLLVAVRRRLQDLQQAIDMNRQVLAATDVTMDQHRHLIRGIDRTSELTVSALRVAASSAVGSTPDIVDGGPAAGPDALRSAFDEINAALASVTARREEASAKMERTVRQVAASAGGGAMPPTQHEETP